jgi:hypothetical protein
VLVVDMRSRNGGQETLPFVGAWWSRFRVFSMPVPTEYTGRVENTLEKVSLWKRRILSDIAHHQSNDDDGDEQFSRPLPRKESVDQAGAVDSTFEYAADPWRPNTFPPVEPLGAMETLILESMLPIAGDDERFPDLFDSLAIM